MKVHLSSALALALSAGVCFAQAPVVDVNSQSNNSATQISDTINGPAKSLSSELESRLAIMERIVDSRSDTQQRMQQQLDMLQADVDTLTGSIELHNHQLEQILARQRELFLELEKRFDSMQQQNASVASNINTSVSSGGSNSSASAGSEQDAYQSAVNLILQDRDFESAIPALRGFLRQYPNSNLTENAHYWLGQLLYNNQDWAAAKEQFVQVADNFADSSKRPDSLYKLGVIAKNMGDEALSQQYFEQVVAEYPESTSARDAQRQLASG